MSLLGDSFSNAASAIEEVGSAILYSLTDMSLLSWLMIAVIVLVVQLLWTRRPSR